MTRLEGGGDTRGVTDDQTASDALIGTTLGDRYRIDAVLGSGGMGTVFAAHHLTLQRDVAVKLLHGPLTADPAIAARFDREALTSARLDHVNCVQVLDAGTADGGRKFIVMQRLHGHELAALLGQPLPPPRAVALIRQVLDGLEHAHGRGIVHRDLKPENVFVVRTDEGHEVLKLVDFGIAKIVEGAGAHDKLTRAGMVFGTPYYMSPEQAAGGTIDHRTDLYAVGAILYEMLAGARLFDADEIGIVLRMQMVADPAPLPASVPAPLQDVVMRLLEKRADDRYDSARAARDALDAAMAASVVFAQGGATMPAPPPPDAVTFAPTLPPVGDTVPAIGPAYSGTAPTPRRSVAALWPFLAVGAAVLVVGLLAWRGCGEHSASPDGSDGRIRSLMSELAAAPTEIAQPADPAEASASADTTTADEADTGAVDPDEPNPATDAPPSTTSPVAGAAAKARAKPKGKRKPGKGKDKGKGKGKGKSR